MSQEPCRLLVLGAHPDDAEISAGGLIVRHARSGSTVKIVSVTDGRSGHHEIAPEELVGIRRQEALEAGRWVGAEYVTWDFADGSLFPTLDVREAIIREIRTFQPDLVLTHRPCDYHPDHRAVGVAVQDASYMVTVPNVCPDSPALHRDPVVAYMTDLFTRPDRLRTDVMIEIGDEFEQVVRMASHHRSQFFQWLPYHDGILDEVPDSPEQRSVWLGRWLDRFYRQRAEFFATEISGRKVAGGDSIRIEAYEVSEYARQPNSQDIQRYFPDAIPPR